MCFATHWVNIRLKTPPLPHAYCSKKFFWITGSKYTKNMQIALGFKYLREYFYFFKIYLFLKSKQLLNGEWYWDVFNMKYVFWLYWSKTKKNLKIAPSIKKLWGLYGFFFLEHITGYTLYELAGDMYSFMIFDEYIFLRYWNVTKRK